MANKLKNLRNNAAKQQQGCCYYCGKPMVLSSETTSGHQPLRLCTAEHLLARQDGGRDTPENIVAACRYCNVQRHHRKAPMEPKSYRKFVRKRLEKGGWQ